MWFPHCKKSTKNPSYLCDRLWAPDYPPGPTSHGNWLNTLKNSVAFEMLGMSATKHGIKVNMTIIHTFSPINLTCNGNTVVGPPLFVPNPSRSRLLGDAGDLVLPFGRSRFIEWSRRTFCTSRTSCRDNLNSFKYNKDWQRKLEWKNKSGPIK